MTTENDAFSALSSMGGLSVLGAISRTIISAERRSFVGFCRGLVLAAFVVVLVGNLITDLSLTQGQKNIIVGLSGFLADDILLLILKMMKILTSNPGKALDWLIKFLTGIRGVPPVNRGPEEPKE